MQIELFDRYVHEVGRHLPRRSRADVAAELHSLLMDALQDRITAGGGSEDAQMVEAYQVAILREFGPPAKVAERYAPRHQYLIGPRLVDLYWIVVAAVLGAMALLHLVLLGLAAWAQAGPGGQPMPSWATWVGSLLDMALKGFAATTLTFIILERVLPASALDDEGEEATWDPHSLPKIQDCTRIQVGELIFATALLVIALIVFNVFPGWVGLNFPGSVNGGPARWFSVPLLSPAFRALYLPWLDALWILSIALNLVLLRRGRWERATRLADLALAVAGVLLLYYLVSGPPILTAEAVETEALRSLAETLLFPLARLGLIVALIGAAVDAAHKLYLVLQDYVGARPGRAA